jgi:RNA-binding protein
VTTTPGEDPRAGAPQLTSTQRKRLRGLAHALEPIVHVGRAGVTEAVVRSVDTALLAHELIKVRLREPDRKRTDSASLAERAGAALCGLVGHTAILYRPHPDEPKIALA